jgi:Xaa-Pro aminopeptidase
VVNIALPAAVYRARREELLARLRSTNPSTIVLLPATPVAYRNSDVEHEYRQDSDLYYFTGFAEPESVAVMSAKTGEFTLFLRPRDAERETWDGPRLGVDGAQTELGATNAYPIAEFAEKLPTLLRDHQRALVRLGRDRVFDGLVFAAVNRSKAFARTGAAVVSEYQDPAPVLHEFRLHKRSEELDLHREAARITCVGHVRAMAAAKAGVREYELEAILNHAFRSHGAERSAYSAIVGSGPNATILHYRAGNRTLGAGELVLIDAGCEYGYYASDVTRTFPVDGTFSAAQREIYEIVLAAEEAGIALATPGTTVDDIHRRCVEVLVDGMLRIGLLTGDAKTLIETEAYKRFYMHRTSHWLGMDVHDVGLYYEAGKARPLAPGMLITVEPGIYVSARDELAPERYRGIGVRIEDDILVTASAPENLTLAIPKQVTDVEAACKRG